MRFAFLKSIRLEAIQGTLAYLVFGSLVIGSAHLAGWGLGGSLLLLAGSAVVFYALIRGSIARLTRSHAALQRERDHYATFVRNSVDGVWRAEVDPPMPLDLSIDEQVDWIYRHARYVEVNPAFVEMYGAASADELVDRPLDETLPRTEINESAIRDFVQQGMRAQNALSSEVAADGSEILIRSNIIGVQQGDRLVQIWGSQLDITIEHRATTEIERQEGLLRNAERIAEIGSWTYHPITEALEWSDNFFRLCGVEPGAFQPTRDTVLSGLHREDRAGWYQALRRTATQGVPSDREVRFFKPDGTMGYFYTRAEPIFDDGRVALVIGVARDVTRRRRAEAAQAELELQVRQLQRLEAIGTLAGGIAHDFNNILSAVMGYTDIALVELSTGHPARASLEEIEKASLRAKDLVEQILSYSRKMEDRRRIVDLDDVVEEALSLMRASLPANIEIREELRVQNPRVLADGSQLHQVIVNLCTNAAQAMPSGGRLTLGVDHLRTSEPLDTATVQLPAGSYVRLRVADSGHGMDDDTLARIFEPFFTTKGARQGTGLGLSTVKGIVLEHQGGIDVRSVLGQGTTFEIYLPLAEKVTATAKEVAAAIPAGGHGTVLLLDDEVALMTLGERMLDRLGYRAVAFNSATAALDAFRRRPDRFDLVITDLRMPEMSGVELAREVQQIAPRTPVVLSTGFSDEEIEQRLEEGLFRALLEKPFNLQTLGECLARVVATIDDGAASERRTSKAFSTPSGETVH
ncbi:MAG: ATP-binding protein [Acidobacteriota bacterium]